MRKKSPQLEPTSSPPAVKTASPALELAMLKHGLDCDEARFVKLYTTPEYCRDPEGAAKALGMPMVMGWEILTRAHVIDVIKEERERRISVLPDKAWVAEYTLKLLDECSKVSDKIKVLELYCKVMGITNSIGVANQINVNLSASEMLSKLDEAEKLSRAGVPIEQAVDAVFDENADSSTKDKKSLKELQEKIHKGS